MISLRNSKGLLIMLLGAATTFHYIAQAQQQAVPPVPKNLQVLSGLSAPQLLQVMRDWSAALGVDCRYCHQDSFETETPRKQIARLMQQEYVATLKRPDGNALNCQDCHQGQANLLSDRSVASATGKQSSEVFRAMRVKLKSIGVVLWRASTKVRFLPKDHFMERMQEFNQALGVNCSYCHKKGDFEAETPRKQIARLMLKDFSAKLTKQDGQLVRCSDCHQGHARPLNKNYSKSLTQRKPSTSVFASG